MKKIIIVIATIIIAISVMAIGHFFYQAIHRVNYPYVAGKTGTKCYQSGFEHKNIIYHVYFNSLEECEQYINKNK